MSDPVSESPHDYRKMPLEEVVRSFMNDPDPPKTQALGFPVRDQETGQTELVVVILARGETAHELNEFIGATVGPGSVVSGKPLGR